MNEKRFDGNEDGTRIWGSDVKMTAKKQRLWITLYLLVIILSWLFAVMRK